MLPAVIQMLENAGINPDPGVSFPSIAIEVDDQEEILPLGDHVGVVAGGVATPVTLPRLSSLWVGDRTPPPFPRGPTPEYLPFFVVIERTAADFCVIDNRIVTDKEFERLYDLLRRRPDGTDSEILFTYLHAAVRLYMALRDVSRAEFEAVLRRLAQSARTFSDGYASRNYFGRALSPLHGSGE